MDSILENHPNWIWDNVKAISELVDNPTRTTYPLATPEGQAEMWNQLEAELVRVFTRKALISVAHACKQKVDESVLEFWKRYNTCWTQEAGLTAAHDPLLISTFISNLQPKFAIAVKQTITGWTTLDKADFMKSLFEKDASGCFELPKKGPEAVHFQAPKFPNTPHKQPMQQQNRWQEKHKPQPRRPPYVGNKPNAPHRSPGCCFNCGKPGHWERECRQLWIQREPANQYIRQEPSEPRNSVSGPKYQIDWNSQTR